MATETTTGIAESLARVFPLGSCINERGRLEVGGCDTIELAREFGTPAYVVAEDDLRARARAFVEAGRAACSGAGATAGPGGWGAAPAPGSCTCCSPPRRSRAPPCCARSRRRGCGATWHPAGRCTSRCRPASPPSGWCCTATRSPRRSCGMALRHRVGLIVIDNLDEIDCLERLLAGR